MKITPFFASCTHYHVTWQWIIIGLLEDQISQRHIYFLPLTFPLLHSP